MLQVPVVLAIFFYIKGYFEISVFEILEADCTENVQKNRL